MSAVTWISSTFANLAQTELFDGLHLSFESMIVVVTVHKLTA
jgi:hypothetical protein